MGDQIALESQQKKKGRKCHDKQQNPKNGKKKKVAHSSRREHSYLKKNENAPQAHQEWRTV